MVQISKIVSFGSLESLGVLERPRWFFQRIPKRGVEVWTTRSMIVAKKQESTRPTITEAVLAMFSKNPKMDSENMIAQIRKNFPWSKFSKTHVAWYKCQIRKGKYSLAGKAKLPPARVAKKSSKGQK